MERYFFGLVLRFLFLYVHSIPLRLCEGEGGGEHGSGEWVNGKCRCEI